MTLIRTSLPLLVAVSLGLAACTGTQTLGSASPGQAADSKTTGSTSDPSTTTNSSGTGGSDGTGGSTGSGGATAGDVKCVPTTDATTGAACKTCYAADGSYTSYCSAPSQNCVDASGKNICGAGGSAGTGGSGGSAGTVVKCGATTDPTTGAACKTCYAADGSVASNDCSGGGSGGSGGTTVKCASSTDPNGVACQTCYASDGSVSSNACTPPPGGASCVGATNIETGQVCKVCSDTTTGKLLFVDCPIPACISPTTTTTTAPPPTK
jgi:hypothetical protein